MSRDPQTPPPRATERLALPPVDELSEPEVAALVGAVQAGVRRYHRARRRRRQLGMALMAAVALLGISTATWTLRSDSRQPRPVAQLAGSTTPAPVDGLPEEGAADDRIEVSEGTRYALEGPRSDRVVHLATGRVRCSVRERAAGERFRVVVGGAEVEVTGTRFDVVAQEDQLSEVRVREGEVLVRLEAGEVLRLHAGERWIRPDAHEAPVPKAPSPESTASEPTRASAPPPEAAFSEAMARFDAADYAGARDTFAQLRTGPLAADARFWAAVSRVKMGRDAEAVEAVEAALVAGVPPERAGSLHCLLGQLLVAQGRPEAADPHWTQALQDPDAAVAACGRAGRPGPEAVRSP